MRQHLDVPGAGHYGICSGRRWREFVYPRLREFILQRHAEGQPSQRAAGPAATAEVQESPAALSVTAAPAHSKRRTRR
jgi:poly(3-hydroxybutyrate) depolymerase